MKKQNYRGAFGRLYHPYKAPKPQSVVWGNIAHAVVLLLVLTAAYLAVNP